MLVALAIVAVLAGSIYASLSIAVKSSRSAVTNIEATRRCQVSLDLIRADLQLAAVPGGRLAGNFLGRSGGEPWSVVNDSLLEFGAIAGDVEPAPGVGDMKRITYSCESSDFDKVDLVRYVQTNLLAPNELLPPRREVICRGLRSILLRYYDGYAWKESWDASASGNVLPTAVEVTLELQTDSGEIQTVPQVMPIPCGRPSTTSGSATGGG